ncbi:hypothetical protein GW943_00185 [Candidatus Parcubacteria bacterium]|nr:hypothetical protein [Candidatus Parcubacteria bacterium]
MGTKPIVHALHYARLQCDGKPCDFGMKSCPEYWRNVFISHFNDTPVGDTDTRWDHLFQVGFPALRHMEALGI